MQHHSFFKLFDKKGMNLLAFKPDYKSVFTISMCPVPGDSTKLFPAKKVPDT